MTSQKMSVDNWLILPKSLVSKYNHRIAMTDTSGIDAKTLPKSELLLLISEMITIKIDDVSTLIT